MLGNSSVAQSMPGKCSPEFVSRDPHPPEKKKKVMLNYANVKYSLNFRMSFIFVYIMYYIQIIFLAFKVNPAKQN